MLTASQISHYYGYLVIQSLYTQTLNWRRKQNEIIGQSWVISGNPKHANCVMARQQKNIMAVYCKTAYQTPAGVRATGTPQNACRAEGEPSGPRAHMN